MNLKLIWFLHSVLLLCCNAEVATEAFTVSGPLVTQDHKILVNTLKAPVYLHNNPKAKDPTLHELVDFIKQDKVNCHRYIIKQFTCMEFAVLLHNNAEVAGWRCGLVSVEFTEGIGHALNVFKTTDNGLVYVDCTGSAASYIGDNDAYDTIGYLEKGQFYGRLPVAVAVKDPNRYGYYSEIQALWATNYAQAQDLETERTALEQYHKQLKPPTDNTEASINEYNLRVKLFNEEKRAHNLKIDKLNNQSNFLKYQYVINESSVKFIEAWW